MKQFNRHFFFIVTLLLSLCVNEAWGDVDATWGTPQGNGAKHNENTYRWKGSTYNSMTLFSFSQGDLLKYTSMQFNADGCDENEVYRILFMNTKDYNSTSGNYDKETTLATLYYNSSNGNGPEGSPIIIDLYNTTELNSIDLSLVTEIRIGGNSTPKADNGGKKIDGDTENYWHEIGLWNVKLIGPDNVYSINWNLSSIPTGENYCDAWYTLGSNTTKYKKNLSNVAEGVTVNYSATDNNGGTWVINGWKYTTDNVPSKYSDAWIGWSSSISKTLKSEETLNKILAVEPEFQNTHIYIANAKEGGSAIVYKKDDADKTNISGTKLKSWETKDVYFYAIPNIGYNFVSWEDGNTDNPRQVTLCESGTTYTHTATFVSTAIYQNLDLSFAYGDETKTRQYRVYVPASVVAEKSTNVPVVFSLHGEGGTNDPAAGSAQNFNELAETNKFIVVYPQGRDNMIWGTSTGWEATGVENEDTKFFEAIISDLSSRDTYKDNGASIFTINPKRIYMTGFSMGGMMTYAVANLMADKFAAFSSISGFPMNEMHLQHHGSRPVPFMHIHGTKDSFVKYSYAPTIADNMIFRNGCNLTPTTTTSDNGAKTNAGVTTKYTKSEYTGGQFPYIYYEIGTGIKASDTGMGHESICYIDGKSSAQMFWEFMSQYTLDSSCDKTIEFNAQLNTDNDENNNVARSHGWTTNSDIILAQYGESGGYTAKNENVYHSIQLNAGTHYLSFNVTGDSGNKITVRLTRLAPLSSFDSMNKDAAQSADEVEVEKAYLIGNKTSICVKFTNTVASEYMLTILRGSKWNNTKISNVKISTTGTETAASEEKDVDTDFGGYYNYNNRLIAQWNFDICDNNRFKTSSINSDYWSVSYTNTDTGDNNAKNGTVIYTYNRAIGTSSGTLTDAGSYSQLTYDGSILIPVSAGLKFMANANLIKIYVDLSNGNETEKHLVLSNGVKMLVPYVENSYRNDKNDASQVSETNKNDFVNCMHHIKRDILYVAVNSGNFWDKINNKCIDLTDQDLFNSGGDEFVNGKTFTKHNYCGKNGTPCVIQITGEAIIDRIGVNRNLTYSFYTEYIDQLGYSKPQPRIRVVGSPTGQKVANISGTAVTYNNAIAMTYGGWKNTEDSYSYTDYDGNSVTDTWSTPNSVDVASAVAADGFSIISQNTVAATSEILMPSSTTGNKYHEACDGKYVATTSNSHKENYTPWTLPCRGGYLKFEPTIPGVLNIDVFQEKDMIYYITDEFGEIIDPSEMFTKTASGQTVDKQDNNGYVLKTRSDYVKFSFNVYPGKSYYTFSPTSGIGFAGFYFEPYVYRKNANEELTRDDVEMKTLELNDGTNYALPDGFTTESTRTIQSPSGENTYVDYVIKSDNKAVTVTLNRSFKANTWNSICLPFSMNTNAMETVFGKGTKVVLLRDIQDKANMASDRTTANFIMHENQDIIAGYPYLIYPTQEVSSIKTNAYIPATTPSIPTISGAGPKTTTGADITTDNYGGLSYYKFKGTFINVTAPKGSYYMNSSGSLSRCTKETGVALKPYRAYLELTDDNQYAKSLEACYFGNTDDNMKSIDINFVRSIVDVICGSTLSGENGSSFDVNGDGVINILDVNAAIGQICGKE